VIRAIVRAAPPIRIIKILSEEQKLAICSSIVHGDNPQVTDDNCLKLKNKIY
jgi:hypothetical protein